MKVRSCVLIVLLSSCNLGGVFIDSTKPVALKDVLKIGKYFISEASAVSYKDPKHVYVAEQKNGIWQWHLAAGKLINGRQLQIVDTTNTELYFSKLEAMALTRDKSVLYALSSPRKKKQKHIYRISISGARSHYQGSDYITLMGEENEKLEGLTCDSQGKNLLIGRRVDENDKYVCTIYRVPISLKTYNLREIEQQVELSDIIQNKATELFFASKVGDLGLSSLEYDTFNKRYLLMTSYENHNLAGICWAIPEKALDSMKKSEIANSISWLPQLVFQGHKPEGISVINSHQCIVVFDDDDFTFAPRSKKNLSIYYIGKSR